MSPTIAANFLLHSAFCLLHSPFVTVLEVIQRSAEFLTRKGVESPRLQVELMLAHLLQLPRLKLYLNFERALTEPQLDTLRGWVKRRGEREPLQHLLGSVSFGGCEIAVNRHVLIPRPETEELAERAVKFLAARKATNDSPLVLDFGTGSGCLAIAVATRCPHVRVHALDVSEDALGVARQNAARHQLAERIIFHCSDAFAALPSDLRFDLIVANPPYIPAAEIESLQPEVRDHDPRLALDGGADGLSFFRRLAADAPAWLAVNGVLMAEFGDGQDVALRPMFVTSPWSLDAVERDDSGRNRFLIARRGGT